jgi:flagellar biosynthetic protein FliR
VTDPASLLELAGLASVLLLSGRVAGLLLMTPLLQAIPMPVTARVLLLLGLSVAIAAPLAASSAVNGGGPGALVPAFLVELATGATLGLGVSMAFAGFTLAGRLVDLQVGFGIGQVFDPLTRTQQPVLASAFGLLGLLLFFLAQGHHALLRGIAFSVERFPIGQAWPFQQALGPVVLQASSLFALGFALAAPVVLGLLLVEFVLGVIARNLPQVNMFVLGVPVKILAGLLLLSLWAAAMGAAAQRLHAGVYRGWTQLFTLGIAGAR